MCSTCLAYFEGMYALNIEKNKLDKQKQGIAKITLGNTFHFINIYSKRIFFLKL